MLHRLHQTPTTSDISGGEMKERRYMLRECTHNRGQANEARSLRILTISTTSRLFTLFLLVLLLPPPSTAILDVAWWSSVAQLSTSNLLAGSTTHYRPICHELKGLSPGQARICELFKDHMPAVGNGAKVAIEECEHQFRDHRWNCSTHRDSGLIGPVHKLGTREAAFTYAIMSAGVSHEVGRRCRLGALKSCGCSEAPKPAGLSERYVWAGCGDNVDYGYRFARDFIDVREREEGGAGGGGPNKRSAEGQGRALMNRWNNEVGRRVLRRNARPKCKCHGVSGACNIKTCWMQLPTMRQVGDILHGKYRKARRIQINSRGNMQFLDGNNHQPQQQTDELFSETPQQQQQHSFRQSNSEEKHRQRQQYKGQLKSKGKRSKGEGSAPPASAPSSSKAARSLKTELVFLDDSPDYCRADRAQGTLGTSGRVCTASSSSRNNLRYHQDGEELASDFYDPISTLNSCDVLCCGRGHNTYTVEKLSKCECKFQWCCQVVCKTCKNVTQVNSCK